MTALLIDKKKLLERMLLLHHQLAGQLKIADEGEESKERQEEKINKAAGIVEAINCLKEQVEELDRKINGRGENTADKEVENLLRQIQDIHGRNLILAKDNYHKLTGELDDLKKGRQALTYLPDRLNIRGHLLDRSC